VNVRSVPSFPEAARISFFGNKPVVTDGPFSEAKEVVGGYCIIEVKSNEEAIEWSDLAHSQEENDPEEEGWRNRNQELRTACCARYGAPSDGTGCHDTLSEHGPNRPIPHDGSGCGNSPGAKRSTGVHFTRCRGPASWTSLFRTGGQRQKRFRVYRGTFVNFRTRS
jgi:hypothetical protein